MEAPLILGRPQLWKELTLLVKRSVVHGHVGDTETEASRLPLPVDSRPADTLLELRRRSYTRNPQIVSLLTDGEGPEPRGTSCSDI